MPKLGTILATQLKKLGIEINDDVKALIELEHEVPQEVADKLNTGLLTLDAAKNNEELKKVFRQQILAGADAKMDDIIKEMGITVGEDFANEKNTYEKIGMLSKALHEHGKKKGEGSSKEGLSESVKKEREEWQRKEAELQQKLNQLTNDLKAKETEFNTTRESDLTSFSLQKKLFGKDFAFPKEMDADLKLQTAQSAINKELLSKGLFIRRNAAGDLVITDKDGNKAYNEKHEAYDNVDNFIDGVLTRNKMLNINDPNGGQQQQQGSGGGKHIPGATEKGNQQIVDAINADLQLFN